jgi:hypothetical protein
MERRNDLSNTLERICRKDGAKSIYRLMYSQLLEGHEAVENRTDFKSKRQLKYLNKAKRVVMTLP